MKLKNILITISLLFIPVFLFLMPSTYFDSGESICLSVRLLNIQCYGCGMTRAFMHLIHFEFYEAWNFNKLIFIVFPLLVMLWFKLLLKQFGIEILKWF